MKLEKGMLISTDNYTWQVLVEVVVNKSNEISLHCICDSANNIYSWNLNAIEQFLQLEEIRDSGYGLPSRLVDKSENLVIRGIPFDVITETLLGRNDDRFSHWAS